MICSKFIYIHAYHLDLYLYSQRIYGKIFGVKYFIYRYLT